MLKTLNMTLIRSPVGLSKEIIAVFQMKKNLKETEYDKTPEFSIFHSFYTFFVIFLTDFVNWKILNGQQRTGCLSSKFFRRVYCIVQNENVSNSHQN